MKTAVRDTPVLGRAIELPGRRVNLRGAFRLVESKFDELDVLILQYRRREGGKELVAAWNAARALRGPSCGAAQPVPAATPAVVS